MTQPRTIEGREFTKFVESDNRPQHSMIEVVVGNTTPIEVDFNEIGETVNSYSEILSLAGLATSTVVLYTVATGKKLKLKRIDFSGGNRAIYSIDVNNSIEAKHRTYYTNYNGEIIFNDLLLVEGDVIKLIVENKTNMTADFNGNLQGRLQDA
tara:strand:+ start:78 stop:536 length:459 start_codon:yes stop_codon:yes gene_type:complete